MHRRTLLLGGLALTSLPAIGTAAEGDWVLLGSRKVRWITDHDMIRVGMAEARFDHIAFVATGNGIFLRDLDVVYSSGANDHIVTRFHLPRDTPSRVIDLRGGERHIRRVEFRYGRPVDFDGPATVRLYGRR